MARRNGRRPQQVGARPDSRSGVRATTRPGVRPRSDAARAGSPDEGLDLLDEPGDQDEPDDQADRVASPDPFGVPASALAPRVLVGALLTTLVACVLGALAVVVYTDATDPQTLSTSTWLSDIGRTVGVSALAGLGLGVMVALLTLWAALALHRQLVGPLLRARLLALAGTVVLWLLAVLLFLHIIGFGGLGSVGFLVGLPGLVVALVMSWFVTPWSLRGVRDADRRSVR